MNCYAAALKGDRGKYDSRYAPKYLPAELVPEFVRRLRPHLLKSRRTWISLLLTDVPEALVLVQEAIEKAEAKDIERLFSGQYNGGPLTRRMLEALRPVLHRFRGNDPTYLVEQAIKDGQKDWVAQNLPEFVFAQDHPHYWLTEADITQSLDALAELVPQGLYAVRATTHYFNAIDSDRHRPAMQDPYQVLRTWLGVTPTDAQITIAALAIVERGKASDIIWWQSLQPQGETTRSHWQNALRLLMLRKWKG